MKRTVNEKKIVITNIIKKINELQLSPRYPAIKEYQQNDYSIILI
jgi:hypothetical protein